MGVVCKLLRRGDVARNHPALDRRRASDRIDHTGELDEHAVPGRLDDSPVVSRDGGIDQVLPVSLQGAKRCDLVNTHKPAVAGHIHGQDCRQSPLEVLIFHRHPQAGAFVNYQDLAVSGAGFDDLLPCVALSAVGATLPFAATPVMAASKC